MNDKVTRAMDALPPDTGLVCPQCGVGVLHDRQCKRLCDQCGYVESCEDNFVPTQANPST